tara:strand:+ start:56 stop:172 length:117 start_codon:yes stop_codon:yes gene_type:complete
MEKRKQDRDKAKERSMAQRLAKSIIRKNIGDRDNGNNI